MGTQRMISVYMCPEDYDSLKAYAERRYGPRKMAKVVRAALLMYLRCRHVPFTGRDPGEFNAEES